MFRHDKNHSNKNLPRIYLDKVLKVYTIMMLIIIVLYYYLIIAINASEI